MDLKSKPKATAKKATASKGKPIKDIKKQSSIVEIDSYMKDTKIEPKKGNGKNSPVIGNNGFMVEKGDNSAAVENMLYIYNMAPIDIDSETAVQERIQEYFTYCIGRDIKPGVEGLAMALGVNRTTLWDWETGRRRSEVDSTRADTIKKAKQFLALYMEHLAQNGKINPVTWIFMMKNHFGYKDIQDISITANDSLGDKLTQADILARLPQDIPIDTTYTEQ